jgi:hypothetical protein
MDRRQREYAHESILTRDTGALELVAIPADMKIERAAICKDSRMTYPTERNSIWQVLNCRNIIKWFEASGRLLPGTRFNSS